MDTLEKLLFRERQKDLLSLANTEAGRFLLGVDKNREIKTLFPHGFTSILGVNGNNIHYVSNFYLWSKIASIFLPTLNSIDLYQEYLQEKNKRLENEYEAFLHFSGLQRNVYKYPTYLYSVDTYSPTASGYGRLYAANATYNTARNAATADAEDTSGDVGVDFTGGQYFFYRSFTPFDTSAIPDSDAFVEGANTFIRLVGGAIDLNTDSDSVRIVSTTQADLASLTTADFDQQGSTALASDKTFGDWVQSGNNDFQLNSTGVAVISKTGSSPFGYRSVNDINSTVPSGRNDVNSVMADNLISVEHISSSPSASLSPSTSISPSSSISASISPSSSLSPSISPSASESISPSASRSPSSSTSSSVSPSASRSPSASLSPSISPSASRSPSSSTSSSVSPSASRSPSSSSSASRSPSASVSLSVSPSSSASESVSPSSSASNSASPSPSSSNSPSPSAGFALYTRDDRSTLPDSDDDLPTLYTDEEEEKVAEDDGRYVGQQGAAEYMIHQFKSFVGNANMFQIEVDVKSELAPNLSAVYLQIYNRNSNTWETIDYDNTSHANTDFLLEKKVRHPENYVNASGVVACRVYQLAI